MTTASTLRADCPPVLGDRDTPALVTPSAGADLPPDPSRDYFPGLTAPIDFILVDAHLLFGPLTPTPQRSLADVVAEIVGRQG